MRDLKLKLNHKKEHFIHKKLDKILSKNVSNIILDYYNFDFKENNYTKFKKTYCEKCRFTDFVCECSNGYITIVY